MIRGVALFTAVMVALQVWDSRNGRGAAGITEFLSVSLAVAGVALLGLAGALQVWMEDVASKQVSHDDGVARMLLALPAVGFGAGVALGSATVLMIVRGVLGADLLLATVGTLLYGALTIVAARTVVRSTQTLFRFAAQQARTAADARAAATAARLDALQARMNPHVLFNALNTVASLVRSDPPAAERVVENLADVLRQTLDRSSQTDGTVADEVDYVRACLALEEERWGERLKVSWNVDKTTLAWPMPAFVIQPLVENALKHGLGSRIEGGRIHVWIAGDEQSLSVSVEDDGTGFPVKWDEGQGLGNLRQRLQTIYGGDASLTIGHSQPGGSAVVVRLPRRRRSVRL